MKQSFKTIKFTKDRLERLKMINSIITDYQQQGYRLTLRQLYYQLVVKNVIKNEERQYKQLSELLTDGRMTGIVDWDAIVDRLRKPERPPHWAGASDIIDACVDQYRRDRMAGQATYIEVWVEKDALSEVLERVTEEYGINICVNRGYSSASAMYQSYLRFRGHRRVRILYLGDFDPSGLDMIRDVKDRIDEFLRDEPSRCNFDVIPIALTREQIEEHEPPPNPAKSTDSRYNKYELENGTTSWEVDSLPPQVLDAVLRKSIESFVKHAIYDAVLEREEEDKELLKKASKYVDNGGQEPDEDDE